MDQFAFLLKTYAKDYEYVKRLVATFQQYNVDHINLYMVVDDADLQLFSADYNLYDNIHVMAQRDVQREFATEENNHTGLSDGYINQEIVKLSFWKTGLCKNYSCIDSEVVFIRDFTRDEFMFNEETPYTVLQEDKELLANPNYYDAFWVGRQNSLEIIQKELDYHNRHALTCHGMQTMNSKVLEHMWTNYMQPNHLEYIDLLNKSPYEFSWYNYYLQKNQVIDIIPCEPHFKTYHMAYQQVSEVLQGVTVQSLARAYCGVILNSNYSRGQVNELDEIEKLDWYFRDRKLLKKASDIVKCSRCRRLKQSIKGKLDIKRRDEKK